MRGERKHHYSVRRKTSGLSRDYAAKTDRHGAWWSETKRMVDAGFRRFFENAGLPAPRVSEHFAESHFMHDPVGIGSTRHTRILTSWD